MNKDHLTIGFGALTGSIPQQLKKAGYKFKPEKAKYYEKLRECLTYIMFADLLPDSQLNKAKQKLVNKIAKHVQIMNK